MSHFLNIKFVILIFILSILMLLSACLKKSHKVQNTSPNNVINLFDSARNTSDSKTSLYHLDQLKSYVLSDEQALLWHQLNVTQSINIQQFNRALQSAQKGYNLSEALGKDSTFGMFNKFLGNIAYYTKQRDEAIKWYTNTIDLAQKGNFWELEANTHNNLGGVYADFQTDSAEKHLLRAIEIMELHHKGISRNCLLSYRILATVRTRTKQPFSEIKPLFNRVISGAEALNDTSLMCSALVFAADFYEQQNEFTRSLEHINRALELQKNSMDTISIITTLKFQAKLLKSLKQFEQANEALYQILSLESKIYNKNLIDKVSKLNVEFETEKLKTKILTNDLEKRKQTSQFITAIASAFLILLVAGFYIFFQRFKHQKEKAASIKQMEKEKLESVIKTEEGERNRIAQELHDGVIQDITAIKLQLKQILPKTDDPIRSELSQLDQYLEETSGEIRNISHQMMPVSLKNLGLISSIQTLLAKQPAHLNRQFEFEYYKMEQPLDPKVELTIYRILQELITNTNKHSKSTFVQIFLSQRKDQLSLLFEDNGIGFKVGQKEGIGLENIKNRVSILNGTFHMDSTPKIGTSIIIRLPIKL